MPRESPRSRDLADCLVAMGARIEGIGSDRLRISGVARLHGTTHSIIPDRIETGTYIMAAAATDGEVRLIGTRLDIVASVARVLEGAGVDVSEIGRRSRRAPARPTASTGSTS